MKEFVPFVGGARFYRQVNLSAFSGQNTGIGQIIQEGQSFSLKWQEHRNRSDYTGRPSYQLTAVRTQE